MSNLITNKYDQSLPERVGDNAKRLEALLSAVNWKRLAKFAFLIHLGVLYFLFTTIVIIHIALHIF
jgi:hypothetical protein